LTVPPGFGSVRAMSAIEEGEIPGTPRRKHRHDLGHEDHGPALAAGTTRAIQILLGLWIAATLLLVVYALVDSARPRSPASSSSAVPANK
jgi:hypothetical protein